MKKKLVIISILILVLLILIKTIYYFSPKSLGEVMGKETFENKIPKVKITCMDGMKSTEIVLTDKKEIKNLIEYLSKQKVRNMFNFGSTFFKSNAENYDIDFLGGLTVETSGGIQLIGAEYVYCTTFKQRIKNSEQKKSVINPYKFIDNIDLNYFRKLFSKVK